MAISNYPVIINGTYDVYWVPYVSASATPLVFNVPSTATNAHFLGSLQEGFTLNWTIAQKEIKSEHMGETVIDGINMGVSSASISGVFQEWNMHNLSTAAGAVGGQTNNIGQLIWPEGASHGDLANVGYQNLYSKGTIPLVAVPRAGTPAATTTHKWFFYATYPEIDQDFEANFNLEEQIVPFTFRCYPVPAYRSEFNNHSIVQPWMDQSQVSSFTSNYTMRFWNCDIA